MEQEKLLKFLCSTDLIKLPQAEIVASHFTYSSYGRHDFVLKEGKVSNEYLFLESGFMRAFAHDTNGNEVTTNFYAANQVIFEVSSFFNRTPSQENIQAVTDCGAWAITFQELNTLFHAMPEFREFGRLMLVRGFASLKARMLSQITETAEERYERLLRHNPEIFRFASLKYIASYLGITDTSLSRIRKELAKK